MEDLHLAIFGLDCLRVFRDGTSQVMEGQSKEEAL